MSVNWQIFGLSAGFAIGLAACSEPSLYGDSPDAHLSPAAGSSAPLPVAFGARQKARFVGSGGTPIGSATLWQGRDAVVLQVEISGLPPGPHGMHLHSEGLCDAPGFKASGGHMQSHDGAHGVFHPNGSHSGDLPNLFVANDGTARVDLFLAPDMFDDILDGDGSALVIHASRDDYQTPPLGGSGARIACAAFPAR